MNTPLLQWAFAALHLLALPLGFAAIVARAAALGGGGAARPDLKRAFAADTAWALAALVWIATGLVRAFAGLEKGTGYYVHNGLFWTKMAFLVLILGLEVLPMVTLIRWRIAARRGEAVDTGRARVLAGISVVQAVLVVAMVLAATGMARGLGVPSGP